MQRAILLGLALVCLVIYLVLQNGDIVDFRLSPSTLFHWNLGALVGGAFVVGVLATLLLGGMQATRRAFVSWRSGRAQRRSERIDQWSDSAEQLIWAGDAQRGRALLQKAWQRRPDDAAAVLALAQSYQDTGELHRARAVLFDAATHLHTHPDILLALAEVHRAAGEKLPRIEVLERLRALHPRAARVLRALRAAYEDAERWRDAATVQEQLLPTVADAQAYPLEQQQLLWLQYEAAMSQRDAAPRLTALESLAAGRNPTVPIMVSLGDALSQATRLDEASAVWERALRATPRTVLVDRLAHLARDSRHRDRVRTLLRKLRPPQVNADAVHLLTAQLWIDDKQVDEATRELQAVQAGDNAPALFHRLWGEIEKLRGHPDQAAVAFARVTEAPSEHECRHCGARSPVWVARCRQCGSWDSLRARVEIATS